MRTEIRAAILALGMVPAIASAELFKCVGADGKTVFSDTRCEAADRGNAANAAKPPEKGADAPKTEGAWVNGRYQPGSADKDRIRALEAAAAQGANDEQKTAASLEVSAIRSGIDSRMTPEAKAKRAALAADLSNPDADKRRDALDKLREIYSNF